MTLTEDLERLKIIDPATYEQLRNYPIYVYEEQSSITIDLIKSTNVNLRGAGIQDVIQRAISTKKTWYLVQNQYPFEPYFYGAYIMIKPYKNCCIDAMSDFEGRGDSPAEAILAAYLQAKEKA